MHSAIREAASADLPAICRLGQSVNLSHHEAWPEIFAPPSDPRRDEAHWQQSIGRPNATTFVAVQDGEVVAFVTIVLVDETNSLMQPLRFARVGSICVAEGLRGRGIGRELMARAEQWSVANGAVDIRLNVWAFNESALRLYTELGYGVRSHMLGKKVASGAG